MTFLVLSVLALGCFAAGGVLGSAWQARKTARWMAIAQQAILALEMQRGMDAILRRVSGPTHLPDAVRSVVMRFEEPAGPKN